MLVLLSLLALFSALVQAQLPCPIGPIIGIGNGTLKGPVKLFMTSATKKGPRLPVDLSFQLAPGGFYQPLVALEPGAKPFGTFSLSGSRLFGDGGTILSIRGKDSNKSKAVQLFMAADSRSVDVVTMVVNGCTFDNKPVAVLNFQSIGAGIGSGAVVKKGVKPGATIFKPPLPIPAQFQGDAVNIEVENKGIK